MYNDKQSIEDTHCGRKYGVIVIPVILLGRVSIHTMMSYFFILSFCNYNSPSQCTYMPQPGFLQLMVAPAASRRVTSAALPLPAALYSCFSSDSDILSHTTQVHTQFIQIWKQTRSHLDCNKKKLFNIDCWVNGMPASSMKSEIKLYPILERSGMYRVPLFIESLNQIGVKSKSVLSFG